MTNTTTTTTDTIEIRAVPGPAFTFVAARRRWPHVLGVLVAAGVAS